MDGLPFSIEPSQLNKMLLMTYVIAGLLQVGLQSYVV